MLRIKFLRESKGLNMREAAKLLGIPYTTYVNYEKGSREPTSEMLIMLADFFNVSIDFLLGRSNDTSPVKVAPVLSVAPSSPASSIKDEEYEIIRKFRCLDDRGQAAVLNVLNHEYDSLPGEKAGSPAKEA